MDRPHGKGILKGAQPQTLRSDKILQEHGVAREEDPTSSTYAYNKMKEIGRSRKRDWVKWETAHLLPLADYNRIKEIMCQRSFRERQGERRNRGREGPALEDNPTSDTFAYNKLKANRQKVSLRLDTADQDDIAVHTLEAPSMPHTTTGPQRHRTGRREDVDWTVAHHSPFGEFRRVREVYRRRSIRELEQENSKPRGDGVLVKDDPTSATYAFHMMVENHKKNREATYSLRATTSVDNTGQLDWENVQYMPEGERDRLRELYRHRSRREINRAKGQLQLSETGLQDDPASDTYKYNKLRKTTAHKDIDWKTAHLLPKEEFDALKKVLAQRSKRERRKLKSNSDDKGIALEDDPTSHTYLYHKFRENSPMKRLSNWETAHLLPAEEFRLLKDRLRKQSARERQKSVQTEARGSALSVDPASATFAYNMLRGIHHTSGQAVPAIDANPADLKGKKPVQFDLNVAATCGSSEDSADESSM
ncbi:hypothetical protein CBS101457_003457 [Exobasidium rhododendri]|nr:hypothetical protein CBS101457_003457 [Exobasidium rhododendri]